MKIVIIGWYGTETLGDRAILLGLIKVFNKTFSDVHISVGSIYPFYTERSIYEDREFISLCSPKSKIDYFDVKEKETLEYKIKRSDLVVMGGGPIMDLNQLGMVRYGFALAKKNNIKTALLGCGIGPLFNSKFQKVALDLLSLSDLIILRDDVSKNNIIDLEINNNFKIDKEIHVTYDPAILPVKVFMDNYKRKEKHSIAINFRDFPSMNYKNVTGEQVDKLLIKILNETSNVYEKIVMFPMHTFSVGGDDRFYLSKLKHIISNDNISIVNKPMSLWDLYELIYNASASIGMRYHSVIFETLLNRNNMIFDYTEPNKGKITGFLNMISGQNFYSSRYINIQTHTDISTLSMEQLLENNLFTYNDSIFDECENIFCGNLKKLF